MENNGMNQFKRIQFLDHVAKIMLRLIHEFLKLFEAIIAKSNYFGHRQNIKMKTKQD